MSKFIEPYNPNWKTEFEIIKQVIEEAFTGFSSEIDIQHVGSTSVPGLPAKPILDIDIIIQNKELLKDLSEKLEELGYIAKGEQGIPGRFAIRQIDDYSPFTRTKHKQPSHHLYVCYSDSLSLKNHLLFRDALRKDAALVEKYAELKKSLTEDSKISREEYTVKKTDFIISVLEKKGLNKTELATIRNQNK
jgi:GrpB-like predicted nucleotidyltransferase (UPF0157 family)